MKLSPIYHLPNLDLRLNMDEVAGTAAAHFKALNKLKIDGLKYNLRISIDRSDLLVLNGEQISRHWLEFI